MATYTFTPRAGVTINSAAFWFGGTRYDVKQALIDGAGSIVTTDDELAARLRTVRVSDGGLALDEAAVGPDSINAPLSASTPSRTLTADAMLSVIGLGPGQGRAHEIRQNGAGGWKITWSGITWVPAGPPPLWTGPNAVNLFEFYSPDGITVYGWAVNAPSDRAQGLPYTHPEAIETFPVLLADNPRSLATGQAVGTFFIPDVDTPITTLASLCNGTPAAANTLAKMAIYEHTGNDNFVGRGRTASGHADATPLWSVAGTNEKPIADDGTGVSGSTPASGLVVRAGIEYVFFCLAIGGTMPQLGGRAPASGLGNIGVPISRWRSRRMCVAVGGLSDFPATFTNQSTVTGAVLWGAGRV